MKHTARWLLSLWCFWLAFSPGNAQSQTKPGTEDPFPLLPGLESSVEFWKKVFTEYSSSQLVYFDPFDMSRIYEVLDVGEESRTPEYINSERERIAALTGSIWNESGPKARIKERTAAGLKRSGATHRTDAADIQGSRPANRIDLPSHRGILLRY